MTRSTSRGTAGLCLLPGDVFHHQKRRAVLIDAYVVELHDGGMRKLANQLCLAQELLFQVFVETVDEGFEGHDAANDIVPRPLDTTRGS